MQNILHKGEIRPRRFASPSFLLRHGNLIVEFVSALFILLFVYTGINKFLAFNDLREVLEKYPLIGSFSEIIAWAVPITELIIAALLFIPRTKKLGLVSSVILMLLFTAYIGFMTIFAPKLPCTCGGMLQEMTWPQHIVFNLFFITLASIGIWLKKERE